VRVTDGYTRLLRVQQLLSGGGWFETRLTHSNWPWGDPNHWTRPLDVVILLLAAPLAPFLGTKGALIAAGALVSPLFHFLACVAMYWASAPVASREARVLAMPVLLAQPGALAYGTLGRADHHMLLVLLFLLTIGAWLRVGEQPLRRRFVVLAGLFAGLALWISPEGLLTVGFVFAVSGISWLVGREGMARAGLQFTAVLATVVSVAVMVERPPLDWLAVEHDRISVAHLTMCLIAAAFWLAAMHAEASGWSQKARIALLGAASPVSLVLLGALHPGYFQGPGSHIHPELYALIMPHIEELQPIVGWSVPDLARTVFQLGGALVGFPLAIMALRHPRSTAARRSLMVLLLLLPAMVFAAGYQMRLLGYASVSIALTVVAGLDWMLFKIGQPAPGVLSRVKRVGAVAGILVGPLIVGGLLTSAAKQEGPGVKGASGRTPECRGPAIADVLGSMNMPSGAKRTLAVHVNMGPELAWRSGHRILSGPYHRSDHGMLDLVETLTTDDAATWRRQIRTREISLILLCPSRDAHMLGTGGEDSLYHRLLDGRLPDGFSPVELPEHPGMSGFHLFEVQLHRLDSET
jgi:asparagine N-glycosylation enzyme membrane subunit Stt3